MPIGPARMPLMEHLGELRMRLVRIVVVLLVAVCVFYMATPTVGQFLLLPIAEFLPQGVDGFSNLTFLDPFEAFTVRFKVAFWVSIVATSPVILWQLIAFFLPALKPNERKWFVPTFSAMVALFILGTVFCYAIILHPAFQWLTDQAIAFQLPIVIFYLVIFDVVPYKKLRGSWRGIYVGLLVFAAMVTPDASPVTMGLMFAALVALYEASLLLSRIVLAKRIKRQDEEIAEDDD